MSIAVAALVLLSIIVVSGGAVRLSGSGLGCEDWPNCNNERILDVSNAHAAVEQGQVRVDGALETRKRAKLRPGQTVRFAGVEITLTQQD